MVYTDLAKLFVVVIIIVIIEEKQENKGVLKQVFDALGMKQSLFLSDLIKAILNQEKLS